MFHGYSQASLKKEEWQAEAIGAARAPAVAESRFAYRAKAGSANMASVFRPFKTKRFGSNSDRQKPMRWPGPWARVGARPSAPSSPGPPPGSSAWPRDLLLMALVDGPDVLLGLPTEFRKDNKYTM